MRITFHRTLPEDPAATPLIDELSAALAEITGDSGKRSFNDADMVDPRSVFLIAKIGELAVACGALRRIDDRMCELKRMYSREKRGGIGSLILAELEKEASRLGYDYIRLETRRVNQRAVGFYLKHGYAVIPNYGKYAGNEAAMCFEKKTPSSQMLEPMAPSDRGST